MEYRHRLTDLPDPPPRGPWLDLGLIALTAAFLLLLCWMQWGCAGPTDAAAGATRAAAAAALPSAPAPASTAAADQQLEHERNDREQLAEQLAAKDAAIRRLEGQRDQLAQQDLRRRLAWLGGIVLIGVLASVGLWFVLPPGLKSWAVYGGLGCLGIAAAAFALRALIPYLELIGWGLVGGGVCFGLWKLAQLKRVAVHAAEHGDRLECAMRDWFPNDEVEPVLKEVKRVSSDRQAEHGVHEVLKGVRTEAKRRAEQLAKKSTKLARLAKAVG